MSPPSTSGGRRAAVLGSPVAHSLSPALHGAAYAALGLDWTYDRVECAEDGLAAFVAGLGPEWAGLSLTMPLKRVALDVAADVTPLARRVGAANTLLLGRSGVVADNTDVPGLAIALRDNGFDDLRAPVLVGGGATACSAAAALASLGAGSLTAIVRSEARAAGLARVCGDLGVRLAYAPWPGAEALARVSLVLSTVPGDAAAPLVPYADGVPALFDVAYAPWPTALAAAVRDAGGAVAGGFELLLHQAALQVTAMTGHDPAPLAAMRAAGEAALAAAP